MLNGFHYRTKMYQWREAHIDRERFSKIGIIFFTEQGQRELKFTEDDKKSMAFGCKISSKIQETN
jgi:hypothetical protein